MNKTIYIIGAGAIGKALAALLKNENRSVKLIRGSVDNVAAHTEEITVVSDKEITAEVEVAGLSEFSDLNGIAVLTNKSYGNYALSLALKSKIKDSPVVLLQNGLGVEQPFLDQGFPEVYRCVLFATSQNISPGKLSFKPVSLSPIGIVKGNGEGLKAVVTHLDSPHFGFRVESNINEVIWKKAIINCVFNSICPLLDIDNGIFHRDERAMAMAREVIEECVLIARDCGVNLQAPEIVDNLLLISQRSDGQLISTLQDIKNGKQTEIDTLNFEIVRLAKAYGKEDIVQKTQLLGELTRLKSELNRRD